MPSNDKHYLTFATKDDFLNYIQEHVMSRSEAQDFLNVSKQSFYRMVKQEKIKPYVMTRESSRNKEFFLKEDLLPYKSELEDINKRHHPYKKKD